jgi:hypothetical protein
MIGSFFCLGGSIPINNNNNSLHACISVSLNPTLDYSYYGLALLGQPAIWSLWITFQMTQKHKQTEREREREKIQFTSIQHHWILHLTRSYELARSACHLEPMTHPVQMTHKRKEKKIQFTKHPTRCSMQSSILLQESLNNRTHPYWQGIEFLKFEFLFDLGMERGVGGTKLHTKRRTGTTMFGAGYWDKYWAGIRKWVRASQGFRWVENWQLSPLVIPWMRSAHWSSHWSENQPTTPRTFKCWWYLVGVVAGSRVQIPSKGVYGYNKLGSR